jgi:hypothetical protein
MKLPPRSMTTIIEIGHSPTAGDRWEMLSVNGRAPTDEELAAFVDEKAEEESGDHREDDDSDKDVVETVQPESLSLIEETGDYWLFRITGYSVLYRKKMKTMKGFSNSLMQR